MTTIPLTRHGILVIVNADDRNAPPAEQTSDYLGTYRDSPRHKNKTSNNIY
jgi:hypothetical protein